MKLPPPRSLPRLDESQPGESHLLDQSRLDGARCDVTPRGESVTPCAMLTDANALPQSSIDGRLFKPDWARVTVHVRNKRKELLRRLLPHGQLSPWVNGLISRHLPELVRAAAAASDHLNAAAVDSPRITPRRAAASLGAETKSGASRRTVKVNRKRSQSHWRGA